MEEILIPVNVLVGDRTYRVRIEQANEEVVRKTVKIINDKIVEFKTSFAGKDMQDYIAMVVLWYATSGSENENGSRQMGDISEKMAGLEATLDKVLQK